VKAAINDLRRRADQACKLAASATSNDIRDAMTAAARQYMQQAAELERALGDGISKDV